ncbi:hypothetical protein [Tautonia sociabilis]|uniref:hypothetical protein n=1 Tax=Tautonia sociabilis TaxID=2080755 RepID=UPI0013154618|nr:hypothetical protein [Tautonia sociabilis]
MRDEPPDWDDDEEDDLLEPNEEEDDDEESGVLPCPSCGAEVFEDAERCPHCGDFIVGRRLRAWEGRPWWWIVLGLLGIGAVIGAFGGF